MAGYVLMIRSLRRERVFRDRSNPFDIYGETEFTIRYRLSKSTAHLLIEEIRPQLQRQTRRNHAITPEEQVFAFLRFLASGNFYTSIGDLHGLSKASVCRIVKHVSDSIACLSNRYIRMPSTTNEIRKMKTSFYEKANFPGVIGVIDCVHIRLVFNIAPHEGGRFINRHHWYSINVQVIGSANFEICNIVARWPGAVHDSRIWNGSRVCAQFESGVYDGYLLGDGGYPCTTAILTPLANPVNQAEARYNDAHVKTRSTIERTFGIWKRRFPCLKYGLRLHVSKVPHLIIAAAVIHNMAINNGDEQFEFEREINDEYNEDNDVQIDDERGLRFRRQLIERYFN